MAMITADSNPIPKSSPHCAHSTELIYDHPTRGLQLVASEPAALICWLNSLGVELTRIGLEAGPLSQWLYAGMKQAGLAVELLETRHVRMH